MHQCKITLNMLRRLKINPKMSAYTQRFWAFYYNQTPITPLGTKVFVHERTSQRRPHADHGKVGYMNGPSPQHYQHVYFYIPTTRGHRYTYTYVFTPLKFELLENAAADRATRALEEITAAIKSKRNQNMPFTNKSIINTIWVLSNLLKPTTQVAPSTVTRSRVSEAGLQRPRVDNNNNDNSRQRVDNTNDDIRPPRVLRPQQEVHQQKYSQGTRVYRIFGEVNWLVEQHPGYICDFDKKKGY